MNKDRMGCVTCESNWADAIPSVYTLSGTQSTQVKLRTHIFSCIVCFPLTPPPRQRAQEREQYFFQRKRKKRKGRNRIVRDEGIRGLGAEDGYQK